MKRLLSQLGVSPQRIRLEWVSAAEGQAFAQVVTDFIGKVKELGPSPLNQESARHE